MTVKVSFNINFSILPFLMQWLIFSDSAFRQTKSFIYGFKVVMVLKKNDLGAELGVSHNAYRLPKI